MSFRLPKSVRSSCLIKPAVEFLIDVADTRFPNEMRHLASCDSVPITPSLEDSDMKPSTAWRFRD